jgi:hypothetical protein
MNPIDYIIYGDFIQVKSSLKNVIRDLYSKICVNENKNQLCEFYIVIVNTFAVLNDSSDKNCLIFIFFNMLVAFGDFAQHIFDLSKDSYSIDFLYEFLNCLKIMYEEFALQRFDKNNIQEKINILVEKILNEMIYPKCIPIYMKKKVEEVLQFN